MHRQFSDVTWVRSTEALARTARYGKTLRATELGLRRTIARTLRATFGESDA